MNTSSMRTRWAAIGAAVAVSLGAGGVGIGNATISSGERPVFVPLDSPCRLASTRPAPDTVGPRTAGIGPDESYVLDGWGAEGNCTLPSGTAALALNVTAVNASQQTNLRFFPADAAVPSTANLNPTPGAPPIPNAVDVNLDGSGRFKVFNKFGIVQVVIDVMGYYEHHHHDDRYYTKAQSDASFLPGGPIVLSQGTNNLIPHNNSPSTQSVNASFVRFSGDGAITASLVGPATIGGAGYRLTSFEYCINTNSPGKVNQVWVYANYPNYVSTSDPTDRSADGCYSIDTTSLPLNRAYTVYMTLKDGGTIDFQAIRTTWSPI